jgi:hypothetical protein
MFNFPTNNTEWAQLIARLCVSGYTDRAIRTQLANHTDIDPNGVPAKAGGFAAGLYVSHKLGPTTDKLVVDGIARYQSWKTKRQQKTAK